MPCAPIGVLGACASKAATARVGRRGGTAGAAVAPGPSSPKKSSKWRCASPRLGTGTCASAAAPGMADETLTDGRGAADGCPRRRQSQVKSAT